VGALCAGANRAPALAQPRPLTVSIDEDTALVKNAIEEKRSARLNPAQVGDVHMAIGYTAQTLGQIETLTTRGHVDQQIQIRVRILVTARQ
jgi:hypothetical protein